MNTLSDKSGRVNAKAPQSVNLVSFILSLLNGTIDEGVVKNVVPGLIKIS